MIPLLEDIFERAIKADGVLADTVIEEESDVSESHPLSPAEQGAIVGAMESVTTLEEAKQILREYP